METIDKQFTGLISKLQHLKELAKQYQGKWPFGEVDHRGLNTGADKFWSQNVQPLVEEIDLDLEDIWDDLTGHTKRGDNFGGYVPPVGTVEQNLRRDINHVINKSRKPDEFEALIQHLKKVQRRRHVKAEASGKARDAKGTETKTELAKVPISELIKQGESQTLEFKETLEYDTEEKKKNKDILHSSLKTIAGFLNTEGGTLLIGVHDSGKIEGIERDLSIMKHSNNDKFELKIRSCLKDRFKPQPIGKVNISFEKFTEGMICRVDVQTSKEIVHLDNEVYVRDGNTTQKLEGQSLTDWVQQKSN